MLIAFRAENGRLTRMDGDADIAGALWIDLYAPPEAQVAALARLGIAVPTLADMEEIEISSRLYREGGVDYMTVVLPGLSMTQAPVAGPVTFILSEARLVTVRHHVPRPFETFPDRAERSALGVASAERLFLGLVEEIVARLADLLEMAGRALDEASRAVVGGDAAGKPDLLRQALEQAGRQGELLSRVRLALLTLERALTYFGQTLGLRMEGAELRAALKGLLRDIEALGVHADFLGGRVSLAVDATLGLINLEQNATVRIVSTVAVLFLPPTLVASIYGMNFAFMPELSWPWGYPAALGLMLLSAVATWVVFKWKRWL